MWHYIELYTCHTDQVHSEQCIVCNVTLYWTLYMPYRSGTLGAVYSVECDTILSFFLCYVQMATAYSQTAEQTCTLGSCSQASTNRGECSQLRLYVFNCSVHYTRHLVWLFRTELLSVYLYLIEGDRGMYGCESWTHNIISVFTYIIEWPIKAVAHKLETVRYWGLVCIL